MRPAFFFAAIALILGVALMFPACKGDTGPAGPSGAPAYCSSPTSQGNTSAGTTPFSYSCCYLLSNAVTLSTASTAVSISTLVGSGPVSGQVVLGIYTNNAGVPGNLVVSSNYVNIATGVTSAPISPTYLPAGTYWMAMNYSNPFPSTFTASAVTEYEIAYPWGVLPMTFPSGTNNGAYFPLWISTCP